VRADAGVAAGTAGAAADPGGSAPVGVATVTDRGDGGSGHRDDARLLVVPYDPCRPPEDPPQGAERLMWYLAERVALDHVPDGHGRCRAPSCATRHESFPCVGVRLANVGRLWAALGPWTEPEPGTVVPRKPRAPSPGFEDSAQ